MTAPFSCSSPLSARLQQHLLQAALLLVLVLPLGAAALWWHGKHQAWQNELQRLESLHARLLGMQQQQDAIAQALQQTEQARTQFFYPADMQAEQAANSALQGLRRVLTQAGMKVESSQVRVPQDADTAADAATADQDSDYTQRIELLVSAEGGWVSLQLALAALRELRPVVSVERIHLSTRMRLQSANPAVEQAINASFTFSVRKLQEGA